MRLFIRFEYQTTERELRDLFSAYGLNGDAQICRDRDGKSMGFGFVEVENGEAAMKELNGTTHRERPLFVEAARSAARDPRRRTAIACPHCGRSVTISLAA
jgi:RNA recognition motif-containing protein